MAIMKVIELMAQSPNGWEDAARMAIQEATRTIHGVQSVYIEHMMAEVENGAITNWRVNAKVTFKVDGTDSVGASRTSTRGGTSGKGAAKKSSGRKTSR